jgi:nucleoside-diphosphate-sugar epimerase
MAINREPTVALLGGGYTLQRVASGLPANRFVITSRNSDVCERWRVSGWNAHQVSVEEPETLRSLWAQYPNISLVVDSVPPLRGGGDPTRGIFNICESFKNTRVSRVLYLSTTGVFGVRDGSVVNETTPANPWNAQGEARFRSEEVYRQCSVQTCALRLPAIYGPDRGLHISIRNGSYRMVGAGDAWTNRIHVEDLSRIILRAIEVPEVPEVLCVSDDCPALARDVVEYTCQRLGVPIPQSVSEEEVLRQGAYTMLSNQRIQNALLKRVLNIQLLYPSYREGFFS